MNLIVIDKQSEIMYPVGSNIRSAISFIDNVVTTMKGQITLKTGNINIWCRGSSGAILAGLLAFKLMPLYPQALIKVVHIKKKGESSHDKDIHHTTFHVNTNNIIIDDFSYSGETINTIAVSMIGRQIDYIDLIILSNVLPIFNERTNSYVLPFATPITLMVGDDRVNYYSELPKLPPTLINTFNT